MKKLLVLGAASAQIPLIKTAKKLGCYVGVVDYDPKAPAIEFADEYFERSLLDVEGIVALSRSFRPNGITCGASDVGVMAAAYVCEELHLDGLSLEVANTVRDKVAMIRAFENNNVAHPKYQVLDTFASDIMVGFPAVTKPIDNCGSRGISIAYSKADLRKALENSFACSKDGRVIVEEYLDGPEVSVEILVQNCEPYVLQVTDKITSGEPHFIEIGHSQPSQLPIPDIKAISELAYNATKAVGVKDGCCHAEIRLTSNGPKMIEIAGRLGGDFITTVLLPISTGVNICEYEILRALGEPKKFDPLCVIDGPGVAVKFIKTKQGTVKSVTSEYVAEEMAGVKEIKLDCQLGVRYGNAVNNSNRFGYVIATGKTPQIALEMCDKALRRIRIETE